MLGGGLIADAAKHSHLDEAQEQVEKLQGALRRFKTELADVEIIADMQVNVDGFLRFADYFFDGLFADWTVMDRIDESISKVKHTKSELLSVIGKLEKKMEDVEPRLMAIREELEKLVLLM